MKLIVGQCIKILFYVVYFVVLFFSKTLWPLQGYAKASIHDLVSLSSTPTWQEFTLKPCKKKFKFEKLAWTGLITFKSKQALKLTELTMQWKGKQIKNLSASLYLKKNRTSKLIPIEENLVCDGVWDRKKQQIIFPLDEKIVAVNSYYLMLSFPRNIESWLKKGKFVVSKQNLLASSL